MYSPSKTVTLVTLGLTAIFLSRALFVFFDDPEGPNLLVVLVTAAGIYGLTYAAYRWYPASFPIGAKKLALLVVLQFVIVGCLYLAGR
jgi:hypothetical protein